MSIDTKSENATSHKYKYNVYVDVNPKTKEGQNLLKQYHEQSSKHYMDIGRIGYHNDHGKYIIDYYTLKELKVVPKLIIRVIKSAMNRAGKDVYQLRTYMSRFGQLNFLLTVDNNYSELFLVENVYISNLNHREDYETSIWKINHFNERPVPLKQIFYEFGIKANPDDYGKSWKEEGVKINSVIVAKAKSELSKVVANKIGPIINQKALVASLNNLSKETSLGKKVLKSYSEKVAKTKEINKLASSLKLENTLNHVLVKTVEENTNKKDLKDKKNLQIYKNIVNVQFTSSKEIAENVEKECTNSKLKEFMLSTFEKKNEKAVLSDEKDLFDLNYKEFEKIIDTNFDKKTHSEKNERNEEKFDKLKYKGKVFPNEFKDFNNKKIEINFDLERFEKNEDLKTKKLREKQEKIEKSKLTKQEKIEGKQKKKLKRFSIVCSVDEELQKSKIEKGIKIEDKKRVQKKNKKHEKDEKLKNKKESKKENLLEKIENRIKKQNLKFAERKEKRKQKKEQKKNKIIEQKIKKEEKKKKKEELNNQLFDKRKSKNKSQESTNVFRPVVKPPEATNKQETEKTKHNNFLNTQHEHKTNDQVLNKAKDVSNAQRIENFLKNRQAQNYNNSYVEKPKKTKEKTLEM